MEAKIRAVYDEHKGRYGYRRITAALCSSMAEPVNHKCFDNAVIESFLGTLKAEYYHLATLDGIAALEVGVDNYIHYYNHERIKLGLRGLSPVEYRLRNTA